MSMMQRVIDFWFQQLSPQEWFSSNCPELDQFIIDEFSQVHASASLGELWEWRETDLGRLAEIIVLDQFSRNMFRNSPKAFLQDAMALVLAQEAILAGADKSLSPMQQSFMYMPLMHSESKSVHELAMKMFSQPGLESSLEFEIKHKEIIDQFGRYPHRNLVLGRESTAAELEFLQQPGSSF